jgi:hypothetical protein
MIDFYVDSSIGERASRVHPSQTTAPAVAVQQLKGASSRWMNETHGKGFSWQEGYGGFHLGRFAKVTHD